MALVCTVLAGISVGALLSGFLWVGVALWVLAYIGVLLAVSVNDGGWLPPTLYGAFAPATVILLVASVVLLVRTSAGPVFTVTVAVAIILAGLDGHLRRLNLYTGIRVSNLPGLEPRPRNTLLGRAYLAAALLVPPVVFFAAVARILGVDPDGVGTSVTVGIVMIQAITAFGVIIDTYYRRRVSRAEYERLPEVLSEYAPRFVFYWDAPSGTAYQVGMWVPYLQRVGVPFFIMVRNPNTFEQAVSQSFGSPVILARTMQDMDRLVPETLTTAFYANNGMKNVHFVRYPQLVHIQLLHGDSDKASSYNPITAMFDRVYVAGQAGIDRYVDHDVDIPLKKFRIVGRPQVEDISGANGPIRDIARPVVLYAPTWRGNYADASYASIPVAPELFERLLERGCQILFRPHPYCYRDDEYRPIIADLHRRLEEHRAETGIEHVYGEVAESEMSVVDCFNACDVMISDVSSVVVDFLYSEKPFALISMGKTVREFEAEFPLAKASYVMEEDRSNWAGALASLLRDDPLASQRSSMREHYLGDFPRNAYADGFTKEARREVARVPGSPKNG